MNKLEELGITADEVKALRDERGISMFEAKNILVTDRLFNRVDQVETIDDVKFILRFLIQRGY
ncbi:hypothetical protein PHIM7_147 [Sinorhizobium phage phiM7]|uniref:Uncharacterized protein n=2 Tax=Emdodecavirus TaxID=1980937 RepID=S5MVA1_9CAUD|nr:hypothetical protein AB690_gp350 [Sinorhizobium phage phiM12]YP_009601272.1 hypothetical protein FDH46_gp331 [Sinorhizobium phage phiM7]AGR47847.2 hypothetical protein SmphiM12_215 [Sinorhizobium phage phiM12]AKF12693.1 hypothetical protein PHIM7_147 [Sinorhizobium phage phiM7]AKF13052.1 hypothetical protein PHIM19_147 [Sinorhizobium phage phiM19]